MKINLHLNRVTQVKKEDMDEFCFAKFYTYSLVVQWVDGLNNKKPMIDVNVFEKKYIVLVQNIMHHHWRLIIVCNHSNIKKCRDYHQRGDEKEGWNGPYPMILIFDSMKGRRVYNMDIKKYIYKFLEMCHDKFRDDDEDNNLFSIDCHESELEEKSKVMPIVFPSNSKF